MKKRNIIIGICTLVILAAAYFAADFNDSGTPTTASIAPTEYVQTEPSNTPAPSAAATSGSEESAAQASEPPAAPSAANAPEPDIQSVKPQEAAPAQAPNAPTPPSETKKPVSETENKAMQCTLSIRCDTILSNRGKLLPGKAELVPHDGVILSERAVSFHDGDSVFSVLRRETKRDKIHLEFVNTPIYNSSYVEGIGNIYEFDCGELSGWVYKVNGFLPNVSSSRYYLKNGDRIEWVYTCDLGADVGGDAVTVGGQRDE